jgi:protein tyrosine phosphatase (PTP) superfamily phosphohydrolase (DUF442 family)
MRKWIVLVIALLLAAGAAAEEGIRNFLRVNERVCTGGQPTLEQLAELKADGVRAVLNLRRPTEKQTPRPGAEPLPYDAAAEAAEAERLGLRYFNIPVDSQAPTDAQVDEFLKILADPQNRPLFIHCSTANRVGAFWMIHRVLVDKWSLEDAAAEAKRIGLSNEKTRAFARDYLARRGQGEQK